MLVRASLNSVLSFEHAELRQSLGLVSSPNLKEMLHKKMNKPINILKKLQWGNFIIILLLGFWGIMSDEPYFRAVGHDLNSFDVVNWFVILITGPASLIAYTLSYGLFI